MADITYTYNKIRKDFGKQPMFCEIPSHMIDSINPDKEEQKKYILRNPVQESSQASSSQSEHYINTKRVIYEVTGSNHAEGGWPRDIPYTDEELTTRYRRRVEKDENYIGTILKNYTKVEHFIKQNNGLEMYNVYFKGMAPIEPLEKVSLQVSNIFKDENKREIASISWTCEDDAKLVVAYCNKKFPITGSLNKNISCSVWSLENAIKPILEFVPPSACWQALSLPVNPSVVLAGLEDGRVCIFDIREKQEYEAISPMHLAHRDPVSALVFMQSRLNNEFFSGSSDGQCMWWDIRNISAPTNRLIMSARLPPGAKVSMDNSEGISTLSFEKSFPTRFLCGTDTGLVVNVNRKGKSFKEIMSATFFAHHGPVKSLQRSPCATKVFITCGDWTVHIWSDDISSAPIITGIPHRHQINDVIWAPQRISSYMTVGADGMFRYWDLLRKSNGPLMTFPVSDQPLLKIKSHDDGKLIAIGDSKGQLHILSLSESMVLSSNKDKPLMIQMFDREIRRERILENRVKEIRLKLAAKVDEVTTTKEELGNQDLSYAEEEYKRNVAQLLKNIPGVQSSGVSRKVKNEMRLR